MTLDPINTLLCPGSLGDTLDAINDAAFFGRDVPLAARRVAALWLADRQGLPGAYAGMFAPTEHDYAFGALTFTGEPITSGAGTGHLLSEEACRALYKLGAESPEIHAIPEVQDALTRARRGIFRRLAESEIQGIWSGVYCCGTCSVALWRHLMVSGQEEDERRMENGLLDLKRYRDGKGRWKRFPFYYTLLALGEMDLPGAKAEIEYAYPVIDRTLRRLIKTDPADHSKHDLRRQRVLERALEKL